MIRVGHNGSISMTRVFLLAIDCTLIRASLSDFACFQTTLNNKSWQKCQVQLDTSVYSILFLLVIRILSQSVFTNNRTI